MMRRLVTPSVEFEVSYRDYIDELADEERYPFTLDLDSDHFPALVAELRRYSSGIDLPHGLVANTTFWLVEDKEIIGVSNLRHHLTERLMRLGGHIGFGVRPSARGKGIAKELLRRTIIEATRRGMSELVVICLEVNEASSRVIEANGGLLESVYSVDEYDERLHRYVI
ncbi:MAG: GNAT family N-acetyltransferase [Pseudomonadota bacterium]